MKILVPRKISIHNIHKYFSNCHFDYPKFPPPVIMCPSLSSFSLDHGKWKIVNGSHYEFGTRIIFTCNPGYYRVGPAHIQCLANGVWSWRNERPRCKSKRLFTEAHPPHKKRNLSIFVCLSIVSKLTLSLCNFVLADDPSLYLKTVAF